MRTPVSIFFRAAAVCLLLLAGVFVGCGGDNEPPAAINPGPPIRKAFLLSLDSAAMQIRTYAMQNGSVPEGEGVQTLFAAGVRSVPENDPWGGTVRYEGRGRSFTLSSAGPDGRWGTKDDCVVTESSAMGAGGY